MANTKISALAAAASLADADVLAGVQSATNKKFALSDIKTYCRERKDVILTADTTTAMRNIGQSNHIVRTAAGVRYAFIVATGTSDIYYTKSSDYGVTWGSPVSIRTGTVAGLAVWFDKWTPGDSGTAIHVAYLDSAAHDVFYRRLDTADDSLGTELTVFNGASAVAGADTCLSITKAKGGLVHVAFDIDGGTEVGHYKSDNATPTSFATADGSGALNEVGTDYYMLFPGNEVATEDIWAVFWDRSADEITLKTYDDSGSAWTESAAITSMADVVSTTVSPQFSGSVRNSDGHLIFVAWSASDSANADLRCWDVNGAASITEKTNVVLNSADDQGACAITVDTTADKLYVFYLGKSDGSETAYTSVNVYYKTSADGGATWGSETALTAAARAVTHLNATLESAADDICVMWAGTEHTGLMVRNSAWA